MKDIHARISVLKEKHRVLDKMCEEEYAQYQDQDILNQHKFQKLAILREIAELEKEIDNG